MSDDDKERYYISAKEFLKSDDEYLISEGVMRLEQILDWKEASGLYDMGKRKLEKIRRKRKMRKIAIVIVALVLMVLLVVFFKMGGKYLQAKKGGSFAKLIGGECIAVFLYVGSCALFFAVSLIDKLTAIEYKEKTQGFIGIIATIVISIVICFGTVILEPKWNSDQEGIIIILLIASAIAIVAIFMEGTKHNVKGIYLRIGAGVVFLGTLLLTNQISQPMYFRNTTASSKPEDSAVWASAKDYVRSQLKNPKSADFCQYWEATIHYTESTGIYTVKGYVDATNSFGAVIRQNFDVNLEMTGDGYKNASVIFY